MEVELKQRLVGASVLIAIAVIFIPMIFDDTRISKNQSITIEIPNEPDTLKRKVLNIDTNIANNQSENSTDKTSHEIAVPDEINVDKIALEPEIIKKEIVLDIVDNSKQKPIVEVPKKENKPVIKPENKPENKPVIKDKEDSVASEKAAENTYRVKFGVFAQQKNAQQLKAQIIQKGKTAIVEKDNASGQFKVYSQSLNSLSDAKKLSQQIQNLQLKIGKPSIESLDHNARLLVESQLDTGWIIQIGIFSSKENSIKLRDKIRNKGFVAFVDEIDTSKNQKLYRVRVGPNATRDEAEAIKVSIKSKMNLKGLIKPHEKQKVIN